MKHNTKIIVLGIATLFFTACSENFLTTEPSGGVLTESQFATLDNTVSTSILGIYSSMYAYGGTHDLFGQRCIDLKTDILSGDIAVTSTTYGWFSTDEMMATSSYETGYFWSYYYDIIHSANVVLHALALTSDVEQKVAEYGLPSSENMEYFTSQDLIDGGFYAEALAIRAYAYLGLVRHYAESYDEIADPTQRLCVPLYNEETAQSMNPQALANVDEVFNMIETDLSLAVDYFEAFKPQRESKLRIDINVARGLLAHAYLNHLDYDNAFEVAKDVIDANAYTILPNAKLLTTGFTDVSEPSWMWGEDVSIETSTSLASFWGQVDIHTYSYAQAGDVKAIDETLLQSIPAWDGRKRWFITDKTNKYYGAPDRKFYNLSSANTTAETDVDRDWLNDNVFMRIESIYLIAAEAALLKSTPDMDAAVSYLTAITDQRLDTTSTAAADYAAYKLTLNTPAALKDAIEYNWRVEMWGEGYGLQTFRRLTKNKKRGGNHYYYAGQEVNSSDVYFTFERPTSEDNYNPNID